MPAVTRLGDSCSGHACFPPRPSTSGASTVFVNGVPVVRQGDTYAVHVCGNSSHPSTLAGGGSVNVEGSPAGRVGDDVACGSVVAQGSSNVFFG